jgi:mRNA interferase YafQ
MYTIERTNSFKKAFKRCVKRGLDISLFETAINILVETGTLPQKYRPHKLSGQYRELWECHISPDWLLIWSQNDETLTLILIDTGSHSDIFG